MNTLRFAGIVLLLWISGCGSLVFALEGYYTEEEVRTYDPVIGRDVVIIRKSWYAGDRMRKDEEWQGITIARFDLNRIYVLDSQMKTCMELTLDFLQEHSAEGLSAFGIRSEQDNELIFPDDLFIRTNTTKRICLWNCYQVMTNPQYRHPDEPYVIIWYSTDVNFPVQIYRDQLKNLFGHTPEVEGLFDRMNQFEGYPVRTEAHVPNHNQITTLIKIEYLEKIDSQLFEIPGDYFIVPFPEASSAPFGRQP